MAVSSRDLRLLYQQSGGRCAFPDCTKSLVFPASSKNPAVALSEVAHIVAQSRDGPRGDYAMSVVERDRYENLILLCEEHHHVIDAQPETFTVERLRQMKNDHEALIAETTRRAMEARAGTPQNNVGVTEQLHSSLLPVQRLPKFVYSVPCDYSEAEAAKVAAHIIRPKDDQVTPFLLRAGRLFCFQNLYERDGPFSQLARGRSVRREPSVEWWEDQNLLRWYMDLLNRTLNKVTGRRGLNLDKLHHRYYFEPPEVGKPLDITYVPLNQSKATRHAVWQPITKKTALPKRFWYHCAVALRFTRVAKRAWCLSVRPEMRVTRDGKTPLESDKIGSRVTKKKSRMFNFGLLQELQFWRDFLFESRPRLIVSFGRSQTLIVSSRLLQTTISWPGVPPERAASFKNVSYEETLFDFADLQRIAAEDDDWEPDWESDDADD